ncbi:MAG: acyl-ACP--UDP-N-acetylglucosamine O-acyltransferase [Candidatus Omnitrophica bacterium]|nr:acyl-ACP--UDP-N-acetylglucosamine O-acyltransferase [Candidatus Omnitrophota bacterium]
MNTIHERAVVSKKAILGDNNTIGPHAVIEEGVTIGSNNMICPGAVIFKGTTMGNGNLIHAGAILGDIPQDIAFDGSETFLEIGNGNRIREYCTIHRGTKAGTKTVIKDNTFLMGYTHVAHNCQIGTGVITVNTVVFGGYVEVGDHAFVSASVVVHQFCRIGKYAMVSGLSAVNMDIPPYLTGGGRPACMTNVNIVGLKRAGFSPDVRKEIKNAFKILYLEGLSRPNAIARIEQECTSAEVKYFVDFIKNSKRGIAAGGEKEDVMM